MAEIKININRYTELHKGIERARAKVAAAKPDITADTSASLALPAFKQRVNELAQLIDAYAGRIESDSRAIYQIGTQLMDQDDALAKAYVNAVASGLGIQ